MLCIGSIRKNSTRILNKKETNYIKVIWILFDFYFKRDFHSFIHNSYNIFMDLHFVVWIQSHFYPDFCCRTRSVVDVSINRSAEIIKVITSKSLFNLAPNWMYEKINSLGQSSYCNQRTCMVARLYGSCQIETNIEYLASEFNHLLQYLIWIVSLSDRVNPRWQVWQTYGLSPLCCLKIKRVSLVLLGFSIPYSEI